MTYVYVLVNGRTKRFYIGFSRDLRRRLREHQAGDSQGCLAYYEAYASEAEARRRERALKQYGSAWGHLKRRIKQSLRPDPRKGLGKKGPGRRPG